MKISVVLLLSVTTLALRADEGLWLYEQFPKGQVAKTYGFEVSQEWLDHLRLASARLGGGSSSFVSPNGLLFTNHHVASGCIQKVSSAEHNYMAAGFYAARPEDELKCPDLEANVLLKWEDVTARIKSAVRAKAGTPQANDQRKAAIARIEKECSSRTGNRCDVVTLYSGALYHLYEYKKYTDIRLVFAPEESIAFFGGDPDNFTYPRYDLDITFLRAYEDGKPASTPQYLKWSAEGPKEGELVFVSGNPGSTDRFITLAEMRFLRDTNYPLALDYLDTTIKTLLAFGAETPENKRIARDKLFSAQNSFKVRSGEYRGLKEASLVERKRQLEDKLRSEIEANPKTRAEVGAAWDEIARAYRNWAPHDAEYQVLERGPLFSTYFTVARNIVRLAEERQKPNEKRLAEYTDAALPSLELRLYSPAPIYDSVETAVLANYFRYLRNRLGFDHPVVKAVLSGRSPEAAAQAYISGSKIKDVAERRRLAGDLNALRQSGDPMIQLARMMDEPARRVRKLYEDSVVAVERASGARIAQARFAIRGASEYPDATFTLRLSYGAVKGYTGATGENIPATVDFAGLYRHATGKEPFKLPPSWEAAKGNLNLRTAFNFVTTADIIGGNSGSPTVNSKGEVAGIVFDHNLEAMPNRFIYSDQHGERAVHVTSQGIVAALRNVYRAARVLKEIGF